MTKYLLPVIIVFFLFGCVSPARTPAVPSRASPAAPQPPATVSPTPLASLPKEVQSIYEEYMLRHAVGQAAREFVSSLPPPAQGSYLGKGIWQVTAKGRWLIKEVGRSVHPMDDEARQLLQELEALGPPPTPRPTPLPRATPAVRLTLPGAIPTPTPTPTPVSGGLPATVKPAPTSTPGLISPPRDWAVHINQTWKFSMAYPPGWTINESWPGRIELTSPGADARIVINAEFTNKGVDEWVEETLGNLSRRLWYFELLFKERYKKGQLEGWIVGYKGRPPFGSPSEYRDLMASDRELQYWVSAYTWNNFQDYVPLLELAVRSFQLAAPPATPLPWWQTGK